MKKIIVLIYLFVMVGYSQTKINYKVYYSTDMENDGLKKQIAELKQQIPQRLDVIGGRSGSKIALHTH